MLGDPVFRRLIGRSAEFIPGRIVGGHEVGQHLYSLFDALAHRLAGIELWLLREHTHGVTRLEMDLPVKLPVEAGEDPQE